MMKSGLNYYIDWCHIADVSVFFPADTKLAVTGNTELKTKLGPVEGIVNISLVAGRRTD